jgi:hypothetical protein
MQQGELREQGAIMVTYGGTQVMMTSNAFL